MTAEPQPCRHVLRVAVWSALLAVVVALLLWYRAEVSRWSPQPPPPIGGATSSRPAEVEILIWLGSSDDVLSRDHLIAITSGAKAWGEAPGRTGIVVVSGESTRRMAAKVVLHSWGVGYGIVTLAADSEAPVIGARTVRLAPGVPEALSARLLRPGAEASALPATPLKMLPRLGTLATAAVVLGNEPLDGSTPTLDMVRRTLKAVDFYRERPGSLLVFTGGATAGGLSEARMMGVIALSRGVPPEAIRLEEQASSTRQNALFCAEIMKDLDVRRVVVISKRTHLNAGMDLFRRLPAFTSAEALPCDVTEAEIAADMEAYLRVFDSPRVRDRLKAIRAGAHGVD